MIRVTFLVLTFVMMMTTAAHAQKKAPTRRGGIAIVIHGAGGGGWEYEKWRRVFQKAGWTVVGRDLTPGKDGLAATEFADYVRQVEQWAADATPSRAEALRAQQGKRSIPLVMIGASMGGLLALKAAEKIKPDALILVNSATPESVPRKRDDKEAPAIIPWANGPLKDTRDAMPDSDEATILAAHKRWRDESGAVVTAIRKGISVQKPKCPVLVVIGEKDTDIPPAASRSLAKWLGADVKAYKGMSHVGPLLSTRAEEVANDIIEWLAKKLAKR